MRLLVWRAHPAGKLQLQKTSTHFPGTSTNVFHTAHRLLRSALSTIKRPIHTNISLNCPHAHPPISYNLNNWSCAVGPLAKMLRRSLKSLPVILVRRHASGRSQASLGGSGSMNVFDRDTKRKQKNRAAMAPDAATYDYLRDEVSCWER